MKRDLTLLYQNIILQHDRMPFYYKKVDNSPVVIPAYNPTCGDQFKLFLNIQNSIIQSAHFYGYGCAISKASTSILIKKIQQMPVSEVSILIARFLQIVDIEQDAPVTADEELAAFSVARQFPERLECATLSWDALRAYWASAPL